MVRSVEKEVDIVGAKLALLADLGKTIDCMGAGS